VWTREHVAGTLLAIRSPAWSGGLTVPGYHWHFLSDDLTIGGHVLDCRTTGNATFQYDVEHDWLVKLEASEAFNQADLTRDLSRELHQVESSRSPAGAAATKP
jgi:acetolactate decarboxylase